MTTTLADLERIAEEEVVLHLGGRRIDEMVKRNVTWAAAWRLADDLHPALDAPLQRMLDGAVVLGVAHEPGNNRIDS